MAGSRIVALNALRFAAVATCLLVALACFLFVDKERERIALASFYASFPPDLLLWNNTAAMSVAIAWPEPMEYDSKSYPAYRPLLDIVKAWSPDIPDISGQFQETLQHFNYSDPREREMASRYRDAEVPFKIYNIPDFNEVVQKWSDDRYLSYELKRRRNHVERSASNHFMYWSAQGKGRRDYNPPTDIVDDMTFESWLAIAKRADMAKSSLNNTKHYYFMSNSAHGNKQGFIAQDLKVFTTRKENFFITNVKANKGIQCRFGMRGIIAEAHYDSGRNMVAMLKGRKRYILTPPETCKQLGIISDPRHPSYRHSVIDWSDITQATTYKFDQVPAIDTIVNKGEVLYIPSYWFHYIVSLEYSIQCNSRSGSPPREEGEKHIKACLGVNQLGRKKSRVA